MKGEKLRQKQFDKKLERSVAHSKILKVLVPIDNLFFERTKQGKQERYFDISQIGEAIAFVNL